MAKSTSTKRKSVSYAKWGYIFIAPFFIAYFIFSLFPLISTFYNSFFENYRDGLTQVGPNFVGLDNYKAVLNSDFLKTLMNTLIIWFMGFIPQILLALLFALWFTDLRLRLKGTGFFKTVIYMPNIIMASSIAVLFFALFSDRGPINTILAHITNNKEYFEMQSTSIFRFFSSTGGVRGIAAFINFLMWYGNTTIILMAGIMGIDTSLYEASQIDGAKGTQTFRYVTLPLLKPILLYVLITAMIGGLQMFDIPQFLTAGSGAPNNTSKTVIMLLNEHLFSKNYGKGGAVSVILFFIAAILSFLVFLSLRDRKKSKGGD